MRTITHHGKRDNLLHVETPLGIVNVYVGLKDTNGQRVERVDYIPNDYAGEAPVKLDHDIGTIRAVEERKL